MDRRNGHLFCNLQVHNCAHCNAPLPDNGIETSVSSTNRNLRSRQVYDLTEIVQVLCVKKRCFVCRGYSSPLVENRWIGGLFISHKRGFTLQLQTFVIASMRNGVTLSQLHAILSSMYGENSRPPSRKFLRNVYTEKEKRAVPYYENCMAMLPIGEHISVDHTFKVAAKLKSIGNRPPAKAMLTVTNSQGILCFSIHIDDL